MTPVAVQPSNTRSPDIGFRLPRTRRWPDRSRETLEPDQGSQQADEALVRLRRLGPVGRRGAGWPERSIWKRWLGFDRAIAASIGLLALAGLLFAVVRGDWPPGTERTAGRVDERRVQLAGLPGLKGFLADHRAQEVDAADLDERLDFSPHVAEELPGGFRLHTAYLVHDRCSAGSCLIYRRGDELVTVVQHAPSHPMSWRSGDLVDCTVAGLACRKARGPGIEILQIEPEGRNLTLVARAGAIDSELFVRALSRR